MSVLDIMIYLALIATIVALVMGVGSMVRGGKHDREHSVHYMTARVGFQAAALVFLLLALLVG